jgi:ABC-2 type transport system permease protein
MLENNIQPLKVHSASNMILSLNNLFALVVILGIILSGKIITDEFSWGTINSLLAIPCKRWKILASKLVAIAISSLSIIAILYIFSAIIGWLFFGFDGFNNHVVTYVNNQIVDRNVLAQSFVLNFYNFFTLLACSSLTLLLSLALKNGIVSTCCSVIVYFLGTQISFALRDYFLIRYTIFANINFQMYFNGIEIFEGLTENYSLIIIIIHIAIFTAGSFYLFNNKRLTR